MKTRTINLLNHKVYPIISDRTQTTTNYFVIRFSYNKEYYNRKNFNLLLAHKISISFIETWFPIKIKNEKTL